MPSNVEMTPDDGTVNLSKALQLWDNPSMENTKMYAGYRYPSQLISRAVWLYHRFTLSFRDIEELLAARGINVSYETLRNWYIKLGNQYSSQIKKKRGQICSSQICKSPSYFLRTKTWRLFQIKNKVINTSR